MVLGEKVRGSPKSYVWIMDICTIFCANPIKHLLSFFPCEKDIAEIAWKNIFHLILKAT